jgi:predicted transcriptional regulator
MKTICVSIGFSAVQPAGWGKLAGSLRLCRAVDLTNVHAIFRPNQQGLKKVLGDLEAEIMEAVWAQGQPVLARDIHSQLPAGKDSSYSTIVCTMTALVEKRLLQVVAKEGKARIYLPTTSREDFLHQTLGHVIDNILAAFPDTAAALMQRRLDTEEASLPRLRQQLDALSAEEQP